MIAQTAQDINAAVQTLHEAKAEAIVHLGFGFGIVFINPALWRRLAWDPPRFTTTAFQNAWVNPIMWNAFMGWVGVDQYDEGNPIGQEFLDRYAAEVRRESARVLRDSGEPRRRRHPRPSVHRRPSAEPARRQGCAGAGQDVARRLGCAREPVSPFGKWTRRAWMGAGYLVARTLGRGRCQLAPGGPIRARRYDMTTQDELDQSTSVAAQGAQSAANATEMGLLDFTVPYWLGFA